MKKRKVPLLNITSDTNDSERVFEALLSTPTVVDIIMKEVLEAIDDSINRGKRKEAQLFKINRSQYTVTIKPDQWVLSLNKALEHFIEKEDYDSCAKCRDLISKI